MSENRWKTIWNSKTTVGEDLSGDEFQRFCELKKANGFDVAVGDEQTYFRNFYDGWIRFYDKATELAGGEIGSVYEVGCGSGVNIFLFRNRIPSAKFGGCDYSESMIKSAGSATGCDDFTCCGADEISEEPRYDLVMAESVFQYFESQEYAERVLRKMIAKSAKLTYLGEIHDKEHEKELMELRRRTIADYEERYRGLDKLFLEKGRIEAIAKECGKKVIFTGVENPEYLNGKYEFNCYII